MCALEICLSTELSVFKKSALLAIIPTKLSGLLNSQLYMADEFDSCFIDGLNEEMILCFSKIGTLNLIYSR